MSNFDTRWQCQINGASVSILPIFLLPLNQNKNISHHHLHLRKSLAFSSGTSTRSKFYLHLKQLIGRISIYILTDNPSISRKIYHYSTILWVWSLWLFKNSLNLYTDMLNPIETLIVLCMRVSIGLSMSVVVRTYRNYKQTSRQNCSQFYS